MRKTMDQLIQRGSYIAAPFMAAIALAGCGNDRKPGASTTTSREVSQPPLTSTSTRVKVGKFTLTFSDLGTPPPYVQVYPGPGETNEERKPNGTFNEGDVVDIDCQTTGRVVNSHPELGEPEKHSNRWFKISGSTGVTQFATEVYALPVQDIQQIPSC